MSDDDLNILANLSYDKTIEMKKTEVKFPNDNEFGPTDWYSQKMFD